MYAWFLFPAQKDSLASEMDVESNEEHNYFSRPDDTFTGTVAYSGTPHGVI